MLLSLKKLLELVKNKLKELDNERLAIISVSIVGLILLLPLLIIAPEFSESEWGLSLFDVFEKYAGFVANGAYVGRLLNLFTARPFQTLKREEKTKVTTLFNKEAIMGRPIGIQEQELTPIGMFLGMGLAIICILLQIAVPFFNVFSYFSYVLYILGYACIIGGLFNRLGSSMDGSRLPQEKKAILCGAFLGLAIALSGIIILMLTGTLPLVAVLGISKVFFDLFVLHKTIFTCIFSLCLISLTTSFFDYFSKALCFLKFVLNSRDTQLQQRVSSRYHEYRGAFLGLLLGCLFTVVIITSLILTGGLAATPVAVAFTVVVTVVTCNSVIPALFSRIGRVIDGIKRMSALVSETLPEEKVLEEFAEKKTTPNQENNESLQANAAKEVGMLIKNEVQNDIGESTQFRQNYSETARHRKEDDQGPPISIHCNQHVGRESNDPNSEPELLKVGHPIHFFKTGVTPPDSQEYPENRAPDSRFEYCM